MIYDIYRKPTTSDNISPSDSCDPSKQKLAAIRYFINRINTYDLSHAEKQKKNRYLKTDCLQQQVPYLHLKQN